MAATFVNSGNLLQLKVLLGDASQSTPYLRLYTNNVTISSTTALSGVTECSASGYSAILLTTGTASYSLVSSTETATYPAQTFSITASATTVGYFVTDNSNSTLLWIEAFSGGPYSVPSAGASVTVTPTVGLS